MRLLILNPNSSQAMTAHVMAAANRLTGTTIEMAACTAASGPPVIATQAAFEQAAQTSMDGLLSQNLQNFDAVLLACFGDPGLEAMQSVSPVPVMGLAQGAMQMAEAQGLPYAVITAGPAWKDILERRFAAWGASSLFCGVELINRSALDVLNSPLSVLPNVQSAIERAKTRGAQRYILGGAVFAGFLQHFPQADHRTEGVVDCLQSALQALARAVSFRQGQTGPGS